MKRKPALAIAAATALFGAAGVVVVGAATGANLFGLHIGAHSAAPAHPPSSGAAPAPSSEASVATLPPAVVMRTEFVDQFVTVTTTAPQAGPLVTTPPGTPPGASDPAAPAPAAPASGPTASAPAATTPAAATPAGTATPQPRVVTAPTTTRPPTTMTPQPSTTVLSPTTTPSPTTVRPPTTVPPSTTTLFDRTRYPFAITIPADWGSKPVPAVPAPAPGRQWSECELHESGYWECQ